MIINTEEDIGRSTMHRQGMQPSKMDNKSVTDAAHILYQMANGISPEMVPKQTDKSPDTVLAVYGKPKEEKHGNNELKIRLRLSETSVEIKRTKKKPEDLNKHGLGQRSKGLTVKPVAVERKIESLGHSKRMSMADPERPSKSAKKMKGGFSFSVIHLLSAVRFALLAGHDEQNNLLSFTIHQILESVRSRPGDPNILETKEPLVDLIRECLKRLSSKTAPIGADNWVPLVAFNKNSRSWSWIGPVPVNLPHDDDNEVKTSSKSWGIPKKNLVNLVKCFSDWLIKSHETLLEIESLPLPPTIFMEPINTMERFKDIRPLKSFCTINPSSVQVRDFFRREEALRYKLPERVFSYTALDGQKSKVGPLVKSCNKPSTKAREHAMLKDDRPPSFTVLSLVRDAAARLPGRTGTRSDICVLVRDSQHIRENVSEIQLSSVVSGALDRLHYEGDPCVKFDKERHLWAYLHGDREDEDFEHEVTARKKRKRRNKEVMQIYGASDEKPAYGN